MEDIFKLIAEVGLPIAGSLAMGFFIFLDNQTNDGWRSWSSKNPDWFL